MDWQRVKNDLASAYGEVGTRQFHFVERRYGKQPYQELVEALRKDYEVQETTDLNDDVALCLALTAGKSTWCLRLSLVGRYAAISDSKGAFVGDHPIPELAGLMERLKENDIDLLSPEDLAHRLAVCSEGESSAYELLFSSDEADSVLK